MKTPRILGPVILFALVVAAASASAGPVLNHPIPTGPIQPATGMAPTPGTPVALNWSSRINMGLPIDCARSPEPTQVIVYQDSDFKGKCAVWTLGFYPRPEELGVADDSISSFKVGRDVRLRAYHGDLFTSGHATFAGPMQMPRVTSDWNDSISSARVEPASRSQDCNDLKDGEVGLYTQTNFSGDCVVLTEGSYGNASMMGLANDSVSSIDNHANKTIYGFFDGDFKTWGLKLGPRAKAPQLESGAHWWLKGINDNMTSMFVGD